MEDNIRSNTPSQKLNLTGVLYIKKKLTNILQEFLTKHLILALKAVTTSGVNNNDI